MEVVQTIGEPSSVASLLITPHAAPNSEAAAVSSGAPRLELGACELGPTNGFVRTRRSLRNTWATTPTHRCAKGFVLSKVGAPNMSFGLPFEKGYMKQNRPKWVTILLVGPCGHRLHGGSWPTNVECACFSKAQRNTKRDTTAFSVTSCVRP